MHSPSRIRASVFIISVDIRSFLMFLHSPLPVRVTAEPYRTVILLAQVLESLQLCASQPVLRRVDSVQVAGSLREEKVRDDIASFAFILLEFLLEPVDVLVIVCSLEVPEFHSEEKEVVCLASDLYRLFEHERLACIFLPNLEIEAFLCAVMVSGCGVDWNLRLCHSLRICLEILFLAFLGNVSADAYH